MLSYLKLLIRYMKCEASQIIVHRKIGLHYLELVLQRDVPSVESLIVGLTPQNAAKNFDAPPGPLSFKRI